MDWCSIPIWARFLICWLAALPVIAFCFGMEWLIDWLGELTEFHDNVEDHAEKPNPL